MGLCPEQTFHMRSRYIGILSTYCAAEEAAAEVAAAVASTLRRGCEGVEIGSGEQHDVISIPDICR